MFLFDEVVHEEVLENTLTADRQHGRDMEMFDDWKQLWAQYLIPQENQERMHAVREMVTPRRQNTSLAEGLAKFRKAVDTFFETVHMKSLRKAFTRLCQFICTTSSSCTILT